MADVRRFTWGSKVLHRGKLIEGTVIGFFKKLNGEGFIAFEVSGLVYFESEFSSDLIGENANDCKHNRGFTVEVLEVGTNHYSCRMGCGYRINFDPEHFVDGIAYVERKASPLDKSITFKYSKY